MTPPGIAELSPAFADLQSNNDAHLITGESHVDIAVAFVMPSGVERLYPHFEDLLQRGGSLRMLTGDYLGVTDQGMSSTTPVNTRSESIHNPW